MTVSIRNFHLSDIHSLYQICLQTGASGEDATGTIDPELLGHIYAAPYALAEPELCFILTLNNLPQGYILGTADSTAFSSWLELHWWPAIRLKYPLNAKRGARAAGLVKEIHHSSSAQPAYVEDYPAHLHIDLLKPVQNAGHGSSLMQYFLTALRDRGVSGVHLGVGKSNQRAVKWYPKFGFEPVFENRYEVVYGLKL